LLLQRAPLELSKSQDAAEVILMDHSDLSLLEGLITNFFVLDSEGALVTAQDGVLEGHSANHSCPPIELVKARVLLFS
jgi:hypothetical protein